MKTTIFNFLCRKYAQSADRRQQGMGLQYMTAETHDLSEQLSRHWENLVQEALVFSPDETRVIMSYGDKRGWIGIHQATVNMLRAKLLKADEYKARSE